MKNSPNLVFAIVFLLGFVFLWNHFVVSRYSPPKPQKTQSSAPAPSSKAPSAAASSPAVVPPAEKPAGQTASATIKASGVQVTVESDGGRVSSWQVDEKESWLELVTNGSRTRNLTLAAFPELNFLIQKRGENQVVFSAVHPSGVYITKTLTLHSPAPFSTVTLSFRNPTSRPVSLETVLGWGPGLNKRTVSGKPVDPKADEAVNAEMRAVGYAGLTKSWKPGFIFQREIDAVDTAPYEWIGVDNNHFLAVFVAVKEPIPAVRVSANRDVPPYAGIPITVALDPGKSSEVTYQLYVGAKRYDQLRGLGHHLDQAVDFGFFGSIAKILLKGLNFFHNLTGNYGWAIILLTLCIQLLVFPLTIKSLRHSVRMREIQPHLKKLQEQFKSDPKRLQAETFNFYKKNGMKFMGMEGCFPMLLQIPIFFAFYSTLNVAYELRGAPWVLWVHNLGAHDPYYVLPLIMGAGMFLQQKMTAVAADPAQAKMMMFMPIMFTFMFLKLPAGLVLYWCMNSLVTIVVQSVMSRRLHHSSQPAT